MSTSPDALTDVLFGQIRGGVLALLYGHTDKSFYVRQIARHLNASVGAVQRQLETLTHVGLLVRSSVGNHIFYQADQSNPVFPEMRALVNKTAGIFGGLHSALEPLSEQISVAFVYGSVARQEEKAHSDVDVMIIGKVKLAEVLNRFSELEAELGRMVNPTVYSVKEFKRRLQAGNHFLTAVVNSRKVFLIGNNDELGKMGGIRMAEERAQQPKRNQRSVGNHPAQPR